MTNNNTTAVDHLLIKFTPEKKTASNSPASDTRSLTQKRMSTHPKSTYSFFLSAIYSRASGSRTKQVTQWKRTDKPCTDLKEKRGRRLTSA